MSEEVTTPPVTITAEATSPIIPPAPEPVIPASDSNNINELMRQAEDDSKAEKAKLLADISSVIDAKLSKKKEVTDLEINKLREELAANQAKAVKAEEDYKARAEQLIKEHKDRLSNIDKFMSENKAVVPDQGNPYREKPPVEKTDSEQYNDFIRAINSRRI